MLASQNNCDNLYQLATKLALEWGLIGHAFDPLPLGLIEALEELENSNQIYISTLRERFQK